MRALGLAIGLTAAVLFTGCTVKVVGAPCDDDLECPHAQYCGDEGACLEGTRTADSACRRAVAVLTARAQTCQGGAIDAYTIAINANPFCASILAGVGQDRLGYDAEQFGTCERNLRALDCTALPLDAAIISSPDNGKLRLVEPALSACPAFVPKVAIDEACNSTTECATGWCHKNPSCPGTCRPYAAPGETCDGNARCAPFSTCSFGKCVTNAVISQACGQNFLGYNVICDPRQSATCKGSVCVARIATGTCELATDCAAAYACVHTDATTSGPRECRPASAQGEACTPGAFQCGPFLYCTGDVPSCQPWPKLGASCGTVASALESPGCLDSQCDGNGKCVVYTPDFCLDARACDSMSDCSGLKCVKRWCG